jgi:hypothetical protein
MNANEIVLVALNGRVTALQKDGGAIVWSTKLPGRANFVTMTGDGQKVYAASIEEIHCLDLISGKLLWSNGLKGHGWGLASVWVPGQAPTPAVDVAGKIQSEASCDGTETVMAVCS